MPLLKYYCLLFSLLFAGFSYAQTSLHVSDNGLLTIKSALVSTDGDVLNEGRIEGDTNSILHLNGTRFQYVGDTLSDTFYLGSIHQINRKGVCYNSNIHLYHDTGYWFKSGSAFTNNRDLWFHGNSIWIDNNPIDKFFVNKGLGLIYKPNSGPALTYPVGFDSFPNAYAPIVLENFGVPDNFGVRVQKGIDFHYNQPFGTPDSSPILSHTVNNTWIINEEVKGGTKLLYTPIWQASHENPGFYRPESIVAWYSEIDHTWHWEDNQPAIGSDPFSARKIDTLFKDQTPLSYFDYMPVSVGDPVSPLPLEFINLHSEWAGETPYLTFNCQFDEIVQNIGILRSTDGINYTMIDTVSINSFKGNFNYTDLAFEKPNHNGWVYYMTVTLNYPTQITSNATSLYFRTEETAVLFPNPATSEVNLFYKVNEVSNGTFELYQTNGQLVKRTNVQFDEYNHLAKIQINDLSAGVYQGVLTINNQKKIFRFIKEF